MHFNAQHNNKLQSCYKVLITKAVGIGIGGVGIGPIPVVLVSVSVQRGIG